MCCMLEQAPSSHHNMCKELSRQPSSHHEQLLTSSRIELGFLPFLFLRPLVLQLLKEALTLAHHHLHSLSYQLIRREDSRRLHREDKVVTNTVDINILFEVILPENIAT